VSSRHYYKGNMSISIEIARKENFIHCRNIFMLQSIVRKQESKDCLYMCGILFFLFLSVLV
jgi:hypothetical protein